MRFLPSHEPEVQGTGRISLQSAHPASLGDGMRHWDGKAPEEAGAAMVWMLVAGVVAPWRMSPNPNPIW